MTTNQTNSPTAANGNPSETPQVAVTVAGKASAEPLKRKEPYEVLTWTEKRAIMISLSIAMFLSALDQNIVVIALPKIVEDLDGVDLLAWVISSYMLTSCATMALYGRFSDVWGRRFIFCVAIVLFLIGSVLSAVASTIWFLIIARGVQGLGGGGLISLSMIIIGDIVQPSDRPKYMSGMTSLFGIASVLAPLVGGVLTDQASWRWVFYINIPFCVLAFVAAFTAMRRLELPTANLPSDVLGSLLIASSAICIVLFVTWGGSPTGYAWDSWIIIFLICLSIILLALFILQELRHPLPILNLRLFKAHNFAVIMFLTFFSFITVFGLFAYIPVYLQNGRGDSALMAGLKFIPYVAGFIIGSMTSGIYLNKTGKYKGWVPAGSAIFTVGTGLLSLMGLHTPYGLLFLYQIIAGFGVGILFPITSVIVQNSVPVVDMANALSAFTFMQSMGGAIGVAVLGAVLNDKLTEALVEDGKALDAAYVYALSWAFIIATVPAGISFFASLLLKEVTLFQIGEAPAKPADIESPAPVSLTATTKSDPSSTSSPASVPTIVKNVLPSPEDAAVNPRLATALAG